MTTSAPQTRIVNALNGEITAPPTKFIAALSEADNFCRELDSLRELQVRNGELEATITSLQADLATALQQRDDARQERDTLRGTASRRGW